MNDTRPQEARGINEVADIVQARMKMGWQDISHINDNGIDGIIIDRKNGIDTGTNYYAQVKCGNSYYYETKSRPEKFGVKLGEEYIAKHKKRWFKIQGPVILIYVDFDTKQAWWTDLKKTETYCHNQNKQIVLIDKKQRFGSHSIGYLRKLRGYIDLDRQLDIIKLKKNDSIFKNISDSLKVAARNFYKNWSRQPINDKTNPILGEIKISRVGWRHITRRGRGLQTIFNSFILLAAASKIIQINEKPYQIKRPDISFSGKYRIIHDYISLRNRIIFPNRQESVVQVIIKRVRRVDMLNGESECKNWFYSVHEPRKGRKTH